jgi:hypothetical protein
VPLPLIKEYLPLIEKETGEKIQTCNNIQEAAAILPDAENHHDLRGIDPGIIKTCRNLKWIFNYFI